MTRMDRGLRAWTWKQHFLKENGAADKSKNSGYLLIFTKEQQEKFCISLMRGMYGNVDAALRFYYICTVPAK